MKKGLIYLFMLIMSIPVFTACSDDEPEIPPTVDDIIATYTTDKLKATVDGKATAENASVNVVKEANSSTTIKLINIVPGTPEFAIPNATFEAITRSSYVSKIAGEVADTIAGYKVNLAGTVDEGVLTANITLTEIEGAATNVKAFYKLIYRGEMAINVSNMAEPVKMTQRVYTQQPSNRDTSSIKLQINNFSFTGIELGDITLDTLKVEKRGSVYGFKAKNRELELAAIGKVVLDVYGTIVDNQMKLTLTVYAGPLTVNVEFTGESVKESTETKAVITIDSDAIVEPVSVSGNTYKFKVWESISAEKLLLTPKIEIPATATLDSVVIYNAAERTHTKIDAKTAIDFSKLDASSYVAYHITPEDIRYPSKKMLYIVRIPILNPVYDMQTWVIGEDDKPAPKGLTTSNLAANFFPMFGIDVPVPVVQAKDNAAEITTSRTVSTTIPNGMIPGVTAGTLFLGDFKVDISNTLKSTHFGAPYNAQPANFKITYKYTPGNTFYKTVTKDNVNDTEVVPNEIDECSIRAYLYEVSSFDETLDGTNINTSKKVILKAELGDGKSQADYKTLTIPFTETGNGSFDPAKKYKLAIVCSSSKRGDEFMGADGSKLWVKHLEVTSK